MNKFLSTLLLVCCVQQVWAADIYRWVDAQGRTHVADSVPTEYRDRAERIDASASAVAPQDAAAARARAERERARLEQAVKSSQPEPSATAGGGAGALNPQAQPQRPQTECAQRWQEYRASLDCFAPYIRGGAQGRGYVTEEGLARCKAVADPAPQCGPAPD